MKKKKRKLFGVICGLVLIGAGLAFGLTGCREMSEADVVSALSTNLEESTSYFATGLMNVESEGQVHEYAVEVAFSQPDYFRVTMRNVATGNEQIILKNADGVFVLTPALNKQFKFQSDWPFTSSQVYLYQSLVTDILNATETVFEVLEDAYVFSLTADYQANGDLVNQVIHFDRKSLTPSLVEVHDATGVVRMSMQFDSFEWNKELGDDFFVVESIMEVAQNVMGEGVTPVINVTDALLYPTYYPEGVSLIDKQTIATDRGERVIMTFGGTHEFTLIQESARIRDVMNPEWMAGEPVMVNGTVGALGDASLSWHRNGIEFFLVSNTLDRAELVVIAASIGEAYEKE